MFTLDSLKLQRYILKQVIVRRSKEYKLLYDDLLGSPLIPDHEIQIKYVDTIESHEKPSPFISDKIYEDIKRLTQKTSFKLTIRYIEIVIHIHYRDHNIERMIHELYHLLQFVVSYTYDLIKHKKTIEINYYLVDHKKHIHGNESLPLQLTKDHVNSGSCQYLSTKNVIHIWRMEELLKVTIHEFLHALDINHFHDTDDIIDYYQEKYHISSETININEAYTEIWANILNCFWISQKYDDKNYQEFCKLLTIEKEFCKFQSDKVFYLTNLSKDRIDINHDTNILSYYIIRNELFSNIQKFLKTCRLNQHYIQMEDSQYTDYLQNTKQMEKNNKKFNKFHKDNYIYRTTRLSCIEYHII
jgi:hypothetical protein